MVAWQPESSLSQDEQDDLRIARNAAFMRHLKRIGELEPEWAVGIVFSAGRPSIPLSPVIELVPAATEQVVIIPGTGPQQAVA